MSRYRWLRPLKIIETMGCFPALEGKPYEELEEILFKKVCAGDIRAMLNNEVVHKAHIEAFLLTYDRANPDQEAFVIPPDMKLNYDDMCAVFDVANLDTRKRGRPRKEHQGWTDDRKLAADMHRMLIGSHPQYPHAKSAAEAARILVEEGLVKGVGTPESRAKRLQREFRKHYSS